MNLVNLRVRVHTKPVSMTPGSVPTEVLCHEVGLIVGRWDLLNDDLTIQNEFLQEEELEVDVL